MKYVASKTSNTLQKCSVARPFYREYHQICVIWRLWHFDAAGPSEKLQKFFLTGISLKSIEKRNERAMDEYFIMKTSEKKRV